MIHCFLLVINNINTSVHACRGYCIIAISPLHRENSKGPEALDHVLITRYSLPNCCPIIYPYHQCRAGLGYFNACEMVSMCISCLGYSGDHVCFLNHSPSVFFCKTVIFIRNFAIFIQGLELIEMKANWKANPTLKVKQNISSTAPDQCEFKHIGS